ncbi:hypothetical protein DFH06DRAFT_1201038 [Mycena polygramma]|nr:hypothetical protein DFH06DRAFT_1201038 [Mycena polygramma]
MSDLRGQTEPSASSKFDAPISPFLLLPPEIVSEIFVKFLPEYPVFPPNFGLLSPFLLCGICRLWRQIALSTPALWSAIWIDAGHDYRDFKKQAAERLQLAKTWLTRSGHSPLSLRLTGVFTHTEFLRQLVETVVAHCERWERVHLVVPFALLHLVRGPMPLLRDLTLGPSELELETHSTLALFERAPQLKAVVLADNFLLSLVHLPWSQLTRVEAHCLYAHECAAILNSASQLVHCEFTMCGDDDDEDIEIPMISIHSNLRHLSLLTLHYNDVDLCSIVSKLTMPALRVLWIFGLSVSTECLQAFVQRSHCVLEELCIVHSSCSQSSYLLPSIEGITLDPPYEDEPI